MISPAIRRVHLFERRFYKVIQYSTIPVGSVLEIFLADYSTTFIHIRLTSAESFFMVVDLEFPNFTTLFF
jgi:hypothetical protein